MGRVEADLSGQTPNETDSADDLHGSCQSNSLHSLSFSKPC